MSKENIPETIMQFWRDNPTPYTKDDIFHLEPESENAVFLKYLALMSSGGGGGQTRGFITCDDEDFMDCNNLIFTVSS